MRDYVKEHPLVIVLSLAAIVLAAVVALEATGTLPWGGAPRPAAARAAPSAEMKLIPVLAAANPEQAYPESAARPLFVPTRRPAPAPAAAASSMVRGQFTLQGVLALGEKRTALLREKSSGRVHRLEKGQEVNGITVGAIDPDKVTLTQGPESEVVTLQVQKGPAVAAAPVPAVASGPFAPQPGAAPAPVAAPGAVPQPAPPGAPAVAGAPAAPGANPAARGTGFGPFPQGQPPGAAAPAEAASQPLTPEELLARRRARRAQQESTPRGPQ